jgi:C4-dicarboxylate-specific signal transduction histidine kinase
LEQRETEVNRRAQLLLWAGWGFAFIAALIAAVIILDHQDVPATAADDPHRHSVSDEPAGLGAANHAAGPLVRWGGAGMVLLLGAAMMLVCRSAIARQHINAALEAERDRLKGILEITPDGVCVVDRDRRIQYANPALQQSLGPIEGRKCFNYLHEQADPCVWCTDPTVPNEKCAQPEWYCARNNRYYTIFNGPFKNPNDGFSKLMVFHDITNLKRAEEEVRQRQAELAHVTRLGTLGEMAAGLAHELNQYYAAITNYVDACAERIRRGPFDSAEVLEDLERAAIAAQRAGEVIDRIRAFARKRGPHRALTDINALVHESVDWLNSDIRRNGVRLIVDPGGDVPAVMADRVQIQQVITNLIRNALEAMGHDSAAARELIIKTRRSDADQIELSVRDSGPGLTSEEMGRVFEPFYTTKPDGIGMGLAISQTIVGAHQGRLWAESNLDRGVTFRFTLPIACAISASEHDEPELHDLRR